MSHGLLGTATGAGSACIARTAVCLRRIAPDLGFAVEKYRPYCGWWPAAHMGQSSTLSLNGVLKNICFGPPVCPPSVSYYSLGCV